MKLAKKRRDQMFLLVAFTIVCCVFKFMMEGVVLNIGGQTLNLGHADAGTYAALLAPILGAHGYVTVKTPEDKDGDGIPDAEQEK